MNSETSHYTMLTILASQPVPIAIPLVLAIVGFGLIVYDFWSRKKREKADDRIVDRIEREQKQKEIEQLEKGESSDPQRQKENEDRYNPSNIK